MIDARERGVQAVIIALGNWVELMIVTAGASDRQAEKSLAGRPDQFIDRIGSDRLQERIMDLADAEQELPNPRRRVL